MSPDEFIYNISAGMRVGHSHSFSQVKLHVLIIFPPVDLARAMTNALKDWEKDNAGLDGMNLDRYYTRGTLHSPCCGSVFGQLHFADWPTKKLLGLIIDRWGCARSTHLLTNLHPPGY